ncbi:DinB family protein [Streptomyces sp. NPDC058045]|uniref:DinB family protein n=1 Tax=Streptomyces sp. NPDC058045 TaxID=3346311 RepID=UPI0036E843A5
MVTLPDGRAVPPPQADERATLESWLDFHRDTLAVKCAGLDDEQVRRAAVPSSALTLLGLVQHLAEVERNWFQRVLAREADVPAVYPDATNGFDLHPERGMAEALERWRAEVARSRELTAGVALEECGLLSEREALFTGSREVSLRWILGHLIEEYARHNGHADLIREALDGTTGP